MTEGKGAGGEQSQVSMILDVFSSLDDSLILSLPLAAWSFFKSDAPDSSIS